MKLSSSKFVLLNLLCFTVFPAGADNATMLYSQQQQMSTNMQQMVKYFQNFGNYLGFDVTNPPQKPQNFVLNYTLINTPVAQLAQTYAFYTYLGSIPVNTYTSGSTANSSGSTGNAATPFSELVPSNLNNIPIAQIANNQVNNTFNGFNGSGSSSTLSTVTANPLFDQSVQQNQSSGATGGAGQGAFQQEPVSQAILNILGTPDATYCMENGNQQNPTIFTTNCKYLYGGLVSQNVIGTSIPTATTFFTGSYISQFLNQLNSNALTGPLMYSTDSLDNAGSTNGGLNAQNQQQLANNFIRYVSGSLVPIKLPKWYDFDQLSLATTPNTDGSVGTKQIQATQLITKYLTSLRTYAAQNSVGVSNLYYIMSKRMPQTPAQGAGTTGTGGQNLTPMSQALSEYNMATWRLFPNGATAAGATNTPSTGGAGGTGGQQENTQWITQLNTAAPATVEKEIAILLAEINYQLYLDRQIHERLLMTNSILLLQSVRSGAPNADLTTSQ
ncbi:MULTISPECIES: type IVB secretion system protein IcmX [Legionella]|uniref:Intracellular multiplication protein IcmX n=1 Tax=Legionella steelei TaxID=947033 RepID=A0A0W0ZHB7_9GAMM|nr:MULTISPECIES: type IVB secretion system protein IcmX [Legionella]KTD68513.1 Intracellular multiplication protein IcmX [Legionella steelei]MBN9227628.1 type IVB secretion system protein IcmX [Legionella steelei]OJW05949.1 MAG: phosphoesterase [Legionella sp. 39-23]